MILLSTIIPPAIFWTRKGKSKTIIDQTTTHRQISTISTTTAPITPIFCTFSCINQTWNSSQNRLSQWLFDGNFLDQINNYDLTPSKSFLFTTEGYVNEAVVFSPNANQMLIGPYIPILNNSFTIDTWLYLSNLMEKADHSIFGLCSVGQMSQCLHITIRSNSEYYFLYLGFYGSDCPGRTHLKLNNWIHATFVFDFSTLQQIIYLDGLLDNICTTPSILTANPTNITIGDIPILEKLMGDNYFRVTDFY